MTVVQRDQAGHGAVLDGGRVWVACTTAVVGVELRRWRRRPAATAGALGLPAAVGAVLSAAGFERGGLPAAVAVLVLVVGRLAEAWVEDRRSGVDERLATTAAPAEAVVAGRAAGMCGLAAASLGGAVLTSWPGVPPSAGAGLVVGAAVALTGGAALVAAGAGTCGEARAASAGVAFLVASVGAVGAASDLPVPAPPVQGAGIGLGLSGLAALLLVPLVDDARCRRPHRSGVRR